jgi:hypothetical protein
MTLPAALKRAQENVEAEAQIAHGIEKLRQMAIRFGVWPANEPAGPAMLDKIEAMFVAHRTMPIDFSVHKFTPKDALDLLGGEERNKNKDNRALGDRIVTRYGNDMTAGRWRTTHQAIAVGPDGRMVDGQHRLEAIIKTGVPVEMILAIYRDEKMAELARQCVDTGRARRCGDSLEIAGVVKRGLGKRVSSILAALAAISEPDKWGGHTTADLRARYDLERPAVDFAATLPNRAFGAPLAASFAYAFPCAAEQTRTFARIVIDKVGIEADSAAYHFVRLFDGKHTSKNQKERVEVTQRALRCIQMHIQGEKTSKIQVSEKGLEFFRNKRLTLGLPT